MPTCMTTAVEAGVVEMVRMLLKMKVPVKNIDGEEACRNGHMEVVRRLTNTV